MKTYRPFRTNTWKRCPFHFKGLECKSRKSRDTWSNRKNWRGVQTKAGQRLTEFCQGALITANTLQTIQEKTLHIDIISVQFSSVTQSINQFNSVTQLCPTLCNPMNRSTPGLPVHHHLLEFTQTHVHRVRDAIQLSHPGSSPSPPAPNPSQHQSLSQWVNSSHEVAKVLEFQL